MKQLKYSLLVGLLSFYLLSWAVADAESQATRCLRNRCYNNFSARGRGGGALIGIGLAYTLYRGIQTAVPQPVPTPLPKLWYCTAFISLSSPWTASEVIRGQTQVNSNYGIAHTRAYMDCKRHGVSLVKGCEILCYQN